MIRPMVENRFWDPHFLSEISRPLDLRSSNTHINTYFTPEKKKIPSTLLEKWVPNIYHKDVQNSIFLIVNITKMRIYHWSLNI